MPDRDRRQRRYEGAASLRGQLNEDQQMALSELERFGWGLRFIRRPLFQDPMPIVADGDRRSYSTLAPDGSVEDIPTIRLRA